MSYSAKTDTLSVVITATLFSISMSPVHAFTQHTSPYPVFFKLSSEIDINKFNSFNAITRHESNDQNFSASKCLSPSSSQLSMLFASQDIFPIESIPSALRSFSGWYSEEAATPSSVVYSDVGSVDTFLSAFADDWPAVSDDDFLGSVSSSVSEPQSYQPFRRIKGFASRAVGILPRPLKRFKRS